MSITRQSPLCFQWNELTHTISNMNGKQTFEKTLCLLPKPPLHFLSLHPTLLQHFKWKGIPIKTSFGMENNRDSAHGMSLIDRCSSEDPNWIGSHFLQTCEISSIFSLWGMTRIYKLSILFPSFQHHISFLSQCTLPPNTSILSTIWRSSPLTLSSLWERRFLYEIR